MWIEWGFLSVNMTHTRIIVYKYMLPQSKKRIHGDEGVDHGLKRPAPDEVWDDHVAIRQVVVNKGESMPQHHPGNAEEANPVKGRQGPGGLLHLQNLLPIGVDREGE